MNSSSSIDLERLAVSYWHININVATVSLKKSSYYIELAQYVPHLILTCIQAVRPGLEVIKLEFILRLEIKHNDWLLADTCPQAANHCTLF